ncbi:hypothetical protein [Verrucomicrobium sp. BvORR106]|nr:hypothetical protein [Verrucomicrobium sp. BvORR106]
MKTATLLLLLATAMAYRWWEFLCAQALGALIQALCNLGFTP